MLILTMLVHIARLQDESEFFFNKKKFYHLNEKFWLLLYLIKFSMTLDR